MIPENIREMPNPYFPITSKLSSKEFIGRTDQVSRLQAILDDYVRTSNLKNIIISGEKSVGKSCLLNRHRQVLQQYNFAVFEVELPRGTGVPIDEFEFFKALLDELFEKYAPPEGVFFDQQQCEIWFSLTRGEYSHSSNFQQRALAFPTQYANQKREFHEVLSYKQVERDFEKVLDELICKEMQIEGLAILVDEFQELSRNTLILDMLRQLSENLTGLMVIGAGLPTFFDNSAFEKFSRISVPIQLGNMRRREILDLIFKPLESLASHRRHEVQQWFDHVSLNEIVSRSGGNPLHIKILCGKMFDYFHNYRSMKRLELNKAVMEDVMEYYSTISEKSNKIRLALQSCRRDQLEAFSLLYQYEGFSIRAALLLQLAFKPLVVEEETATKDTILAAFEDIWDLGLFVLKDRTLQLEGLKKLSVDSLSHVEYSFIGDAIDKLYAGYYYEGLIGKTLNHNNGMSFEDILTRKLAEDLTSFLYTKKIPKDVVFGEPIIEIGSPGRDERKSGHDVVTDLDNLVETAKKYKESDEKRNLLLQLAQKHRLDFPAHLAIILGLEGYYLVIAEVNVKGKKRLVYSYIPVKAALSKIVEVRERIRDLFIDALALAQYMVSIEFVYVYWIPSRALMAITYVDLDKLGEELRDSVLRRDFDRAVTLAEGIMHLTTRISVTKREIMAEALHTNNYGFCLININSLAKAKEKLEPCEGRVLLSSLNLAYIAYIENDYSKAKQILKRIVKKNIGRDEDASVLHLAINHRKLPFANRLLHDVCAYNVAAWNLALIVSQERGDQSIVYSYLKKVKTKKDEFLIDLRVRYWIDYYRGDVDGAIKKCKGMLALCSGIEYLNRDVMRDTQIFTT